MGRMTAIVIVFSVIAGCSSGGESTVSTSSSPGTTAAPAAIDVRISEVHYHAPADREDEEFVEIVNRGKGVVELQGWCIDGVDFCFPESTLLDPGEFLAVGPDRFAGSLSNKGEELSVVDPLGQVFDIVAYADREPWSELADGGGHSLQRVEFALEGSDPLGWSSAVPTPGGPFVVAERATIGDVVITEISYHPEDDDPAKRFIELFNTTSATIDLVNWCIEGAEYCWTESTPIDAGGVLALSAPPRLSRSSDRLRIIDDVGAVHDVVRFDDTDPWPALADGHGQSLHRRDVVASGLEAGNWESREPSPGAPDLPSGGELIPIVEDVAFPLLPAAGSPLDVTARVRGDFTAANLVYRIGFDPEVTIPMTVDGENITSSIPGQFPGSLIRFRIDVIGPIAGAYPRVGDGANYAGTVVASEANPPTPLTRFQWFIPDEVYEEARIETTLHGDDGFPAVFAVNGEVMDNVIIRIKGNQARSNKKRKWKVMLPAGHEWDMGGMLDNPVDEFDLLPAATDKSFSREILTSDMQAMSGGVRQQVFPVRLEKNGEFFGLYMYGESSDADWRDKIGLSVDSLVYKAERVAKLSVSSLEFDDDTFATYYQRYSQTYLDDGDVRLRELIDQLSRMDDEEQIRFAYEHVDVPQVIEAIATMRVVQHPEWQHKNYFVILDPVDDRWRLLPIDFDLNFGRRYASPCNARCDEVKAFPWMDYPNGNRLARIFLENDHFLEMVDRRTRTLADAFLAPGYLENRIAELFALMEVDAELDRKKWGQYGESQSLSRAQQILLEQYVVPKRAMYLESDKYLPPSQSENFDLAIDIVEANENGKVIRAAITNPGMVAVDVSGRVFEEIGARLPAGVVIRPGATIDVLFDRVPVDIDANADIATLRLTIVGERWTESDGTQTDG